MPPTFLKYSENFSFPSIHEIEITLVHLDEKLYVHACAFTSKLNLAGPLVFISVFPMLILFRVLLVNYSEFSNVSQMFSFKM